jgi:hypothetical protein
MRERFVWVVLTHKDRWGGRSTETELHCHPVYMTALLVKTVTGGRSASRQNIRDSIGRVEGVFSSMLWAVAGGRESQTASC